MSYYGDIKRGFLPVNKDIPIPVGRVKAKHVDWDRVKKALNFDRLSVGDCYIVPLNFALGASPIQLQNYVSGAACKYRKEQPFGSWAFTTRQMANGSCCVWRIDPCEARKRGE